MGDKQSRTLLFLIFLISWKGSMWNSCMYLNKNTHSLYFSNFEINCVAMSSAVTRVLLSPELSIIIIILTAVFITTVILVVGFLCLKRYVITLLSGTSAWIWATNVHYDAFVRIGFHYSQLYSCEPQTELRKKTPLQCYIYKIQLECKRENSIYYYNHIGEGIISSEYKRKALPG